MSKKLFVISITLIGCILFHARCYGNELDHPVEIAIMTTADIQSCIVPYTVVIEGDTLTVGGLERIAAASNQIRSKVDGSLLLSSGDDLIGPLFSLLSGEPEIRGMSMADYDVVTPGNHEFDRGVDIYKNAISFSNFNIVSANLIIDDQELANRIHPYIIKDVAGLKVGIFGMMTPELLKVCNIPGGGAVVNQDIVKVADNIVNELKKSDCDIIIGVTHVGVTFDRELAQEVDSIDIIVGGHDHEYINETVGSTIIVQDGSRAKYLGVLRFVFDKGEIQNPIWERVLLDSTVGYNPAIKDLMAQYMKIYNDSLGMVIGESTVEMDACRGVNRSRETNLGNIIADSWLDWFTDADVALVNAGAIRGDQIYPTGSITYLTVNEILPFRNEVYMVQLTGAELKQVFEVSASVLRVADDGCPDTCRASDGGFLQVGGVKITIDTTQAPFCAVYSGRDVSKIINVGSRIISIEVYQNDSWVSLDTSAIYTVLTNSWMAIGGDGHYIFRSEDIQKKNTTLITTDLLTSYIQSHTPVAPQIESRIKFLVK
ncbi:bifunctional metallophosphatase/5'-nucleotidase [candidate division WOR-3 bacterium]|nr:bifunctional metallophosphatase/5'-nucleotidase [candidate division WOR-3 bacterium]